jgi:Mrp family chromosome partitioning ATPase
MPANAAYAWLSARARNAVRRRALVTIAAAIAFVASLIGLVLIPREASRAARTLTTTSTQARADTTLVRASFDAAARAIHDLDSALASARRQNVLATPPPPPPDTISPELRAVRDSLNALIASLGAAMSHAAETPLPPAFRDLAQTPALRDDPHVRMLLDSLDQVDKLRAPFGALGAGDPIYVALTARVNEIGRSLRDAAAAKRSELRARVAPLLPPPPPPAPTVQHVDTMHIVAQRVGAQREYATAGRVLDSMRIVNARADSATSRARDLANVGAPPIAMLGAALVIALAVGFAVAFVGELRHPRLAHIREGEAVSGTRVLAVIERTNVVERSRRQADVEAPPLVDIISESYRTLYLHLAATGASVPVVTVTGHIPAVVATVATNLAAVAAYEARSTLLVDADPASNAVAAVLRIPSEPGLQGVLTGHEDWPRAVVTTTIGRDRPLDVLPGGTGRIGNASPDAVRTVREALGRLERRYDFIVIAAPTSYVQLASNTIIPAPDVVICARVGETRLDDLRAEVKSLRGIGRVVHGIVLWDEEAPRIAPRARESQRTSADAAA